MTLIRTITWVATVGGVLMGALPAWAEPGEPDKAGVTVAVVGTTTVTRSASPEPAPLKFRDDIFLRDRIATGEDSLARLLLGVKALVTVDELSVFTITDQPDRAIVNLGQGKLAVGVAKSQLRPGEAVEIRTPNAVVAIRGSLVVVEVTFANGVPDTRVVTLEVSVPVTVTLSTPTPATLLLPSGNTVRVSGRQAAITHTPIRQLTPEQRRESEQVASAPRRFHRADLASPRVAEMVNDAARLATMLTTTSKSISKVKTPSVEPTGEVSLDFAPRLRQPTRPLLTPDAKRASRPDLGPIRNGGPNVATPIARPTPTVAAPTGPSLRDPVRPRTPRVTSPTLPPPNLPAPGRTADPIPPAPPPPGGVTGPTLPPPNLPGPGDRSNQTVSKPSSPLK